MIDVYVFLGLLLAIPLIICVIAVRSERNAVPFGPIPPDQYVSDEEFLAACRPGVRPEVAFKVRHIVADQLNIPEHTIHPNNSFTDLGAD